MSYRFQILHGSSYGQSQQITQNKFSNYVITSLLCNYAITKQNANLQRNKEMQKAQKVKTIELKVWTPLSLLYTIYYYYTVSVLFRT